MMIASPAARPVSPAWRPRRLLLLALVALGDRLFDGHAKGLSLALFVLALAAAVPLGNPVRRDPRTWRLACALLGLGILPLVEDAGLLALLFGAGGLAAFAVLVTGGLAPGRRAVLAAVRRMLLAGPVQLVRDLGTALARPAAVGPDGRVGGALLGWVLPLLLCGLFGLLFASANPLIDAWLSAISWSALWSEIRLGRLLTWLLLAALAGPLVALRLRDPAPPAAAGVSPSPAPGHRAAALRLDAAVVLRCLVLFNLLFALQSWLDLLFLWGGLGLPDGLTYAAYAHRGAYPLVLTALLAAGFGLAALGPDGPGARSAAIRRLGALWSGQNVVREAAILRLDLYVAAYSLTTVRAAAFVWMGLVAVGLVLIVARIALRRSNGWLVAANAGVLGLVLYAYAFVNLPALVSAYNVAHSRELGGAGGAFDLGYALSLGPDAIPAVDRYIAVGSGPALGRARDWRLWAAAEHRQAMADWRAWTFRDWRLARYLAERPAPPAAVSNPTEIR